MEELFNVLSSTARFRKQSEKKRKAQPDERVLEPSFDNEIMQPAKGGARTEGQSIASYPKPLDKTTSQRSRDRTGKRDMSDEKQQQVHKEKIAAFRRAMSIHIANKHDNNLPDPIASFNEMTCPSWWKKVVSDEERQLFQSLCNLILRNVEGGRWKDPTPIQMQSIPGLLHRRDLIGAAPTGSGKSGAFILPALLLTRAPNNAFYGVSLANDTRSTASKGGKRHARVTGSRQGEIRGLLLAPSFELASQLLREVERLSWGIPGGQSSVLLSKANASQVLSGAVGGKRGLDLLVSTPLRLVDCIEKGLRLDAVRIVVLDEADRLLDAADGKVERRISSKHEGENPDEEGIEEDEIEGVRSGSVQSKTFLAQMDAILSDIPPTAVRALFSATVTPTVRSLAESILRNPVDVTVRIAPGGANPDIQQQLMFVGREEGKLLAIRQIVHRGELLPPVIIFLQSQERAQALFGELLYDNIHVDVIHAGRSKSSRENAVAKFRRGDTWVLICTDLVGRGVDFRAVNMVINYDLPESGISYIHRIGRTGRAGRHGKAITFFTEADFGHVRTIAHIMKQSGCRVEDWILNLPRKRENKIPPRRKEIDTNPAKQRRKRHRVNPSSFSTQLGPDAARKPK